MSIWTSIFDNYIYGLVHEKWLNWLASVSKKKNIRDLAQNLQKATYVNWYSSRLYS